MGIVEINLDAGVVLGFGVDFFTLWGRSVM